MGDICLDKMSENKLLFECIASRYLCIELYQYMNYTKRILKLLKIREQVQHQSFTLKTNRTAMDTISCIILILFILFYAIFISMFFPQFIKIKLYSKVWFVWVVLFGFCVACQVIHPFVHLNSVVQLQNDMRKCFPYHLLIVFSISYVVSWGIAAIMIVNDMHKILLTTASMPSEEFSVKEKSQAIQLYMLAFVVQSIFAALCYTHGLRILLSIIFAYYQHYRKRNNLFGRIVKTIKNCHAELTLLLFFITYSTTACWISFHIQLQWALDSNSEINRYVLISFAVVVVLSVFTAYNYALPWWHNKVLKVTLWVVMKKQQFVGFLMHFRKSRSNIKKIKADEV